MKTDHLGMIPIKVILLGPTNTGKTSIISRYVSNTFPYLHDITIAIDFYQKALKIQKTYIKLEIWDTFGIYSGRKQALEFAKCADAAIFVFDISSKESFNNLRYYIEEFKKCHSDKFYCVLLGNKKDKNKDEVDTSEAEGLANEFGMDYFCVTAVNEDGIPGINECFETIAKSVLKGEGVIIDDFEEDNDEKEQNDQFVKDSLHYTIEKFVTSMSKIFPVDDFVVFLIGEMNEYYKENINNKKNPKTFEELKSIINDLLIIKAKLLFLLKISGTSIITSNPNNSSELKKKNSVKVAKKEAVNNQEEELNNFFASNSLLRDSIATTIYNYIVSFIKRFINKSQQEKLSMIFPETKNDNLENLSMRKKELMTFFSDDYIKYRNSSDLHDFFQFRTQLNFIFSRKEYFIYQAIKGKEISYYKTAGDEMVSYLKQYRYAFNDKWNKVTMEGIKELNFYQIEEKIHYYGYKAFLHYKTAYQFADKSIENISEQVSLRADIAYSYYLMGFYLKANFYILAANLIIMNNRDKLNNSTIDYVRIIGNKISQGLYEDETSYTTEKNTKKLMANSTRMSINSIMKESINMHLNQNPDMPFDEKGNTANINQQLAGIHFDTDQLKESNPFEKKTSKEQDGKKGLNIKELKQKIYKNIFIGLSYLDNEFSSFGQREGELPGKKISKKKLKSSEGSNIRLNQRNVNKYLKFLVVPGLVAYGVMKLVDKYQFTKQMKQFQQIREKLYNIYTNSLNHFKRKQFHLFLQTLTEPFMDKKSLIKFNYKENCITVEPTEMSATLMKYGFKPDDIVNLLNLLGISLLSLCGGASYNKGTDSDFKRNKKLAIKVFKAGLNENLLLEAEQVDKSLRETIQLGTNEKLFTENIEEIRNCIRINLIMLLILKDKDRTKEYIKDVENTIYKMRFYPINEQLEVSKDLISALYGTGFYEDGKNVSQYDNALFDRKLQKFTYAKMENDSISHIALYSTNSKYLDECWVFNTITKGRFNFTKKYFVDTFEAHCIKAKKTETDFFKNILEIEMAQSPKHWKTKFQMDGKLFQPLFLPYLSKYYNIKINLFSPSTFEHDGVIIPIYKYTSSIDLGDPKSHLYCSIYLCEDEKHNITHAFIPFCNIEDPLANQIDFVEKYEKDYPQLATQVYLNALKIFEINSTEKKINNTYYKCLFKLSLFKELIRFITADKINTPLQLRYLVLAEMKLGRYQNCINYLRRYFKKEKEDNYYFSHDILEYLIKEKALEKDYVKYYAELDKRITTVVNRSIINKEGSFRILSLDGGGIRMLIQLLILCEIENITQKPICEMFDLVIGTSTGAIIAAALCLEKENKIPLFKTYELLNFVLDNQDMLFWEETKKQLTEETYKYSLTKKKTFLSRIFTTKTIKNSLTNLAITAYNVTSHKTEIFTSYSKEKKPINKISSITQILEIATAIPSFFSPIKIKDDEFCDGCLSAFNPSIFGVEEAINVLNIEKRQIKLLSIGTGYYPLMEKEIMWENKEDYPDGPIDGDNYNAHVTSLLNAETNVYHRLEIQLPTPVKLDNLSSFNDLLSYTKEYIMEMNFGGKFQEMINSIVN